MSAVWKFVLKVADVQEVMMPAGAECLCAAEQAGHLCIWAKVDPSAPLEPRTIAVYGTGHPAPDDGHYIGTAFFRGGALVFHVFEKLP